MMNRLILIGNGFDLAHGLKTSFKDFLEDYVLSILKEFSVKTVYDDALIHIRWKNNEPRMGSPVPFDGNGKEALIKFKELRSDHRNINMNFKSAPSLLDIVLSSENLGWVDIEKSSLMD